MCAYVSFLAMGHRAVDQGEPVVELLGSLDGLLRVECVRGCMTMRGRNIRRGGAGYLAEFTTDGRGRRTR